MKKSIAVLMLGSAILLPNYNSVEASYSETKGQVPSVQYVQWNETGSLYDLCFPKSISKMGVSKPIFQLEKSKGKYTYYTLGLKAKGYVHHVDKGQWKKPVAEQEEDVTPTPEEQPAPSTPDVQPEPTTPAEPVPSKPAEEPTTPTQEVEPAPTPTPSNPAPSTPETNPTPSTPVDQTNDASLSAIEKEVLDLTNAERQKAGLAPLQSDKNLMTAARAKSTDMATNRYFSHDSPTYGSPFDQMKSFGVTYRSAAENIAQGQRSAQEVVNSWMNSPGHRQNILTSNFTHIGIGYDANGHYWTQQFIQK